MAEDAAAGAVWRVVAKSVLDMVLGVVVQLPMASVRGKLRDKLLGYLYAPFVLSQP